MKQFVTDPQDTEAAGHSTSDRSSELALQHWDRAKSRALAECEDMDFTDAHWAVIVFLRKYYLEQGLPRHARVTARALNRNFADQGGNKYLHQLFSGGPVTQGSRLAMLRTPAYATDSSFGTSF